MNRLERLTLPLAFVALTMIWAPMASGQQESADDASAPATEVAVSRQILVTFEQPPTRRLPAVGSSPRAYGGRDSYKTSPRAARMARKLAREYGLELVDEWPIEMLDVHCVVYRVPLEYDTHEVLKRLSEDSRIDSAQPMQLFEVLAQRRYNDPHFPLQHGLQAMQVPEAHEWGQGKGVLVAVIDTGVDVDHPDLAGRVSIAENFVDDDTVGFTRDAHGTAVAGVIASRPNNGIGIVGVAPSVHLLALKACWQEASGSSPAICSSFTLAKAISFAAARSADLLNLSLSGPSDPLLGALLRKAISRGIVVVSAVPENATDGTGFPASLDGVIAVRSSGDSAPIRAGANLTLAAPGADVLTTQPQGSYDFMSGSSLAAAHVSGVAALLLEQRPRLAQPSLRELLEATSNPSGTVTGDVNACAALARLLAVAGCGDGADHSTGATPSSL